MFIYCWVERGEGGGGLSLKPVIVLFPVVSLSGAINIGILQLALCSMAFTQ